MTAGKNLHIVCPRCRVPVSWQDNPHRPFCSERCRLIDLGQWADEEYRIPVRPAEGDEFDGPGLSPDPSAEED